MDLLGLNVIHGKFGPGIVTKENGRTITVEFLNRTSSFVHPDAFYLHLKAEDESIQQILEREAIASIEQGRQAQIAWQKDRDEQIRAQVSKLYHPVNDFNEFMQIAQHMCIDPGCTTCGAMHFRLMCREMVGYEKICELIRAVTPEFFAEHYTLRWMMAVTIMDCIFHLPRDNFMMQELDRLSREHENSRRKPPVVLPDNPTRIKDALSKSANGLKLKEIGRALRIKKKTVLQILTSNPEQFQRNESDFTWHYIG